MISFFKKTANRESRASIYFSLKIINFELFWRDFFAENRAVLHLEIKLWVVVF